jgi:hypothetical protein
MLLRGRDLPCSRSAGARTRTMTAFGQLTLRGRKQMQSESVLPCKIDTSSARRYDFVQVSNSFEIARRERAVAAGAVADSQRWPLKRSASRMFVTNLLSRSGPELVLDMRSKPRWANEALGTRTTWMEGGTATTGDATIFHVWSSNLAGLAAAGRLLSAEVAGQV